MTPLLYEFAQDVETAWCAWMRIAQENMPAQPQSPHACDSITALLTDQLVKKLSSEQETGAEARTKQGKMRKECRKKKGELNCSEEQMKEYWLVTWSDGVCTCNSPFPLHCEVSLLFFSWCVYAQSKHQQNIVSFSFCFSLPSEAILVSSQFTVYSTTYYNTPSVTLPFHTHRGDKNGCLAEETNTNITSHKMAGKNVL